MFCLRVNNYTGEYTLIKRNVTLTEEEMKQIVDSYNHIQKSRTINLDELEVRE